MTSWIPVAVRLKASSDVGRARRSVRNLAASLGATEAQASVSAQVATELATNLLRYATAGVLAAYPDPRGLALVSIDSGPGITDIDGALRDGSSGSSGLGLGLGAIRRSSHVFELTSSPNGTILLAVIPLSTTLESSRPPVSQPCSATPPWRIGAALTPARGEREIGDSFTYRCYADGQTLDVAVVDGLGHGPLAHIASRAACTLEWNCDEPLNSIVQRMHQNLQRTRGAAGTLVRVKRQGGELTVSQAAVGNVQTRILVPDGPAQSLLPQPGILGRKVPGIRMEQRTVPAGSWLLISSDGVASAWLRTPTPRSPEVSPAIVAGRVLRAHGRGHDDATCVVVGPQLER